MRFQQLHLKAFGAFTDRKLDLTQGKQGLHLIHGPNEAGKSTTLRAITQLLYGIETRTSDGFLHPLGSLRIGATLVNGSDSLAFVRRKGNKNTLLSPDEKSVLDDDALAAYLGAVDVTTFTNFFGLSHDQLVRGGQGLVQGEGDVGQALFSAAAGMGNLRALLNRLESDAADLFSPRASKPAINSALSRLKDLRKELKDLQLSSSAWEALDQERQEADKRQAALAHELETARAELSRLKRVRDALPLVGERVTLLEALDPLLDAVVLREDFTERRQLCQTEARAAETAKENAAKALDAYVRELAGLPVNDVLLAHEATLEELNERRAQNQKALADCERELAPLLQRLEMEIERALHQLRPHWTLDQVEDLRLAPGQERRIHELSREGNTVHVQLENARTALQKRKREQEQAASALEAMGTVPEFSDVERTLKLAHQASATARESAHLAGRVKQLRHSIEAGIARLGFWSGEVDTLERLALPGIAGIEAFRLELETAERDLQLGNEAAANLEGRLREAETQLHAYQSAHDVPSLADLEQARDTRQQGWHWVRTSWEKGVRPAEVADAEALAWAATHPDTSDLADAFQTAVERADTVADRLRNEADRVAGRAQLESTITALSEDLREARLAVESLEQARLQLADQWKALWSPVDIEPKSPREMAEFRHAVSDLLNEINALREAEASLATQSDRTAHGLEQLRIALTESGAPAGGATLDDAIASAESWVDEQRNRTQQIRSLESTARKLAEEDVPDAEAEVESAAAALEVWQESWGSVTEALGAPSGATSGEVLALMEAIDGLLTKADESADLRRRIDRIKRDDSIFRESVHALAESLSEMENSGDEAAWVQQWYTNLNRSRAARQERERLVKLRDVESARLREAEVALARVEATWKTLCEEAGVSDADDLAGAEKRSAMRQRLEESLRAVDKQLVALSAGAGLEVLLDLVSAADPDTLDTRITDLENRIEDLDDERLDLSGKRGRLDEQLRQMDGSDAAARKEEEAQSLVAAISEDAEAYARARIAALVLRTAIEQYRAANQEPLLSRAGEHFRQLTLGSFAELRADVSEKDEHVLCGVRAETNALVPVNGMSEGTADQLYLALRLASLERHLENHPPIPFILDDILVNFDDQRAAAALQVLAEVSERTQVIYFTHHVHLVELAKGCVDKKRLFVQSLVE